MVAFPGYYIDSDPAMRPGEIRILGPLAWRICPADHAQLFHAHVKYIGHCQQCDRLVLVPEHFIPNACPGRYSL